MRIEIATMKGEIPRLEPHLLPNEAAERSLNCHYERGIIAPMQSDVLSATLPLSGPKTLFFYAHTHWFTFADRVSVLANPMAQDPYQRVYWSGQGKPKVTAQDIATGSGTMPKAWYDLGVPRPSVKPQVTKVDAATGMDPPQGELPAYDDEDRLYIQTYVTRFGEEGAPSAASASVLIEKPASTVTVQLGTLGANTHNITHRRLYRSVSAAGEGDFLLVAELPISQTQYLDAARTINGPSLVTWDYDVPDPNMQGLCAMANGICAGFAGNEVMFSEAYLPYAWSKSNRGITDDEIVAIVPIETSLVVATKGKPFLFSGVTPSLITGTQLNIEQACVSAESLVVINGTALYASPDGLVAISSSSAALVSDPIIDRATWQSFAPHTIKAWAVEGYYVAQCESGAFLFDLASSSFTRLSHRWTAAYAYLPHDALYYAKGSELYRWRAGSSVIGMEWLSKPFLIPQHTLLTCARIQSPDPSRLALSVLADGQEVLVLAQGELTAEPFRLPPIRASRWQLKVSGTAKVERLLLGDTFAELW